MNKKTILSVASIIIFSLFLNTSSSAQNLISVHSVQSIAQMNALSPATGSILFVNDENANYQYIGSGWVKIGADTTGLGSASNTINNYITANQNCFCDPFYEVGDTLECGIVVYVEENGKSGLICSFDEWVLDFGCPTNTNVANSGISIVDGLINSNSINASCNSSAASTCLNYNECGSGWYMPSRNELENIFINYTLLNFRLIGMQQTPISSGLYWSSTEAQNASQANQFAESQVLNLSSTNNRDVNNTVKIQSGRVRAFKRFHNYD